MLVEDSTGTMLNLEDWKRIVVAHFIHPFYPEKKYWDVYVEGHRRDPGYYNDIEGNLKEMAPSFSLLEKFTTEEGAMNFAKKLPRTNQPIEVRRH